METILAMLVVVVVIIMAAALVSRRLRRRRGAIMSPELYDDPAARSDGRSGAERERPDAT